MGQLEIEGLIFLFLSREKNVVLIVEQCFFSMRDMGDNNGGGYCVWVYHYRSRLENGELRWDISDE